MTSKAKKSKKYPKGITAVECPKPHYRDQERQSSLMTSKAKKSKKYQKGITAVECPKSHYRGLKRQSSLTTSKEKKSRKYPKGITAVEFVKSHNHENDLDISKEISPVEASEKRIKIGFVGNGSFVTSIILKSLLRTGHAVTVWENTIKQLATDRGYECFKHESTSSWSRKLERSIIKRAICEGKGQFEDDIRNCSWTFSVAPDPAAVVELSDVTFSCFLDCESRDQALNCEYGLLHHTLRYTSKGYVEMTTIDPDTSKETAEEIKNRNGQYLEACGWPSVQLADENRLTLLLAGSEELYKACSSIFQNIAERLRYYGNHVGYAATLSLLHNFLASVNVAALAESTLLSNKLGIDAQTWRFVLDEVLHFSPYYLNQVDAMTEKQYQADTSIDYMRHSLSMLQKMAFSEDEFGQVTGANFQVYTKAVTKGLGSRDICAVHKVNQPGFPF